MRDTTTDGQALIEVRNVTKEYGKKEHLFKALDGVDLEVRAGESVAIIGKSGSGKSTMMHVISGLDRATSGTIIVDGENMLEMKPRAMDAFRAQKMAFIFQSFFVEGGETCYDNVSLALETARVPRTDRKARIKEALEAVDLADKIDARAKNLSGGQKQRLAIARAIVGRPKILFADEPTGNLDSATSDVIENLLFDYARDNGATLIIVTHDEELAERCQRTVRIKDGRIVDSKSPRPKVATPKPNSTRPAKARASKPAHTSAKPRPKRKVIQ